MFVREAAQSFDELPELGGQQRARGAQVDAAGLAAFIDKLPLPDADRARLRALTPAQYVGLAASLARGI